LFTNGPGLQDRRSMAAIELRSVAKQFGDTEVLLPIDLTIPDGEFLVLLGPSGCGKTTLLRMIAGLEDVTSGDILIDGELVTDKRARDRNIAMVFQNYPHLTVAKNLAFPLEAQGVPADRIRATVEEVSAKLGLTEFLARKPGQLSGGQRQRVAVGRAMVRDPKVFLFDEPLSNLDASLREGMRGELVKLHGALRNTIIYVTHDQVEAMTMAERIVVLRDGKVQQIGTAMEIYSEPRNMFIAQFIGSPSMNMVPGSLRRRGQDCKLQVGDSDIEMAAGFAADGQIHVGFRPTDVRLAAGTEPSDRLRIQVDVTAIQPLGHDVLVDVSSVSNGWNAVVQIPWKTFTGKVSDRLMLEVPQDALHLFDSKTETRLPFRS
jgi:ABC-type sugar transport system ATPase subunit